MLDHIKSAIAKSNAFTVAGLYVYIKDPLTVDLDIKSIIKNIRKIIPNQLMSNVDAIIIGDFDFLNKRKLNALYNDNSIYISNKQSNAQDIIDDIIHETGHAIEQTYQKNLYGDGALEYEFLLKRKALKKILGQFGYPVEKYNFENIEYDINFDSFLYKDVGYDKLSMLTANLFCSPYAATSIREYFANAFEKWYVEKNNNLMKLSPVAYEKIYNLINS